MFLAILREEEVLEDKVEEEVVTIIMINYPLTKNRLFSYSGDQGRGDQDRSQGRG